MHRNRSTMTTIPVDFNEFRKNFDVHFSDVISGTFKLAKRLKEEQPTECYWNCFVSVWLLNTGKRSVRYNAATSRPNIGNYVRFVRTRRRCNGWDAKNVSFFFFFFLILFFNSIHVRFVQTPRTIQDTRAYRLPWLHGDGPKVVVCRSVFVIKPLCAHANLGRKRTSRLPAQPRVFQQRCPVQCSTLHIIVIVIIIVG